MAAAAAAARPLTGSLHPHLSADASFRQICICICSRCQPVLTRVSSTRRRRRWHCGIEHVRISQKQRAVYFDNSARCFYPKQNISRTAERLLRIVVTWTYIAEYILNRKYRNIIFILYQTCKQSVLWRENYASYLVAWMANAIDEDNVAS